MKVLKYSEEAFNEIFKSSKLKDYFLGYTKGINAQTIVIEEKYIDKFYLIDYQLYYSRSFEDIERFTTRVHFFYSIFSQKEFETMLEQGNLKSIENSYLGFIIKRTVSKDNETVYIGRTVLKTYLNSDPSGYERVFISSENKISLFGAKFEINSLAFQEQDKQVGACASYSLWIALQALKNIFETKSYSPYEITQLANSYTNITRDFPSEGLSILQMVHLIKAVKLEVDSVDLTKNHEEKNDKDIYALENLIHASMRAYFKIGIPIIGILELKKKITPELHSVVISGYKEDKDRKLVEIYVHDDQIGPYSRVNSKNGFIHWENFWKKEKGYSEVQLDLLLVPLYFKIRVPLPKILYFTKHTCREEIKETHPDMSTVELIPYLYTVQMYKNELLLKNIENKIEILKMPMPHYLWIIRVFDEWKVNMDIVVDASSSISLKTFTEIVYLD